MEEPVSKIQSFGQHRKKNTSMVRVSTEKGFSFHVSLFGMDNIGTGFKQFEGQNNHPNLTYFRSY